MIFIVTHMLTYFTSVFGNAGLIFWLFFSGPYMRNWQVLLLRNKQCCIIREWMRSHLTSDTVHITLVRNRMNRLFPLYYVDGNVQKQKRICFSWTFFVLHKSVFCVWFVGDQNAINDLMQMRLSAGGGGGMMAEKLEVRGHIVTAVLLP